MPTSFGCLFERAYIHWKWNTPAASWMVSLGTGLKVPFQAAFTDYGELGDWGENQCSNSDKDFNFVGLSLCNWRLNPANHQAGFDFLKNMVLYDGDDRESIYWGLNRVFDYDKGKINRSIENQVRLSALWAIVDHWVCEWWKCNYSLDVGHRLSTLWSYQHLTTSAILW